MTTRGHKILNAFDKIGRTNGTVLNEADIQLPKMTNAETQHAIERELAAYELFCAGELRSAANSRHERAKDRAIELGLLNVTKASIGVSTLLYDGAYVVISVKIARPRTTLDTNMLKSNLRKIGISAEAITKAMNDSMKEATPAKTFVAVYKDD